ncbi:FliM/FliN family flagellar motor switch protein [Sphingosinicella terrae]|uniref:FliM/FliN family flagellar motor switch protein n=1 Tax=Sphingosinicella terrae TaxID=2172047 RepID=UPI002548CDD4|nr:FliM/FliN family flagellar motor switch protein [Sphingosinicella terrae]
MLDNVPVEMSIVLGSTHLPIRQLLKMGRGALIPLDCGYDDPTELYVNDQLVARGKIQVTGDRMSLEIAEVVRRSR